MLVHFVVVVVENLEFGEVSDFKSVKIKLLWFYREIVKITFMRKTGKSNLIESMRV
jgi:hypothetical protein